MSVVMELISVNRNYIIIGIIALVCFYVAYKFYMRDDTQSIELMNTQFKSTEESLKSIDILPENITEEIVKDEHNCNENMCVRKP